MVVPSDDLRALCESAALATGFSPDDARDLTAALMEGSLRSRPGQGQGVQSLPKYLTRVRDGVIDAQAEIVEVRGSGPMRLLDAGRAHGGVAATRAMDAALELSETYGIGAVGVRNSTHLGAAGYFAELATEQGCIGVVFTNAGPEIAPWGAAPKQSSAPTRGRWRCRRAKGGLWCSIWRTRPRAREWSAGTSSPGDAIPDDWALTTDGQRTTDPVAALAGTLFPLGGPKGYAMAVIVDC